MYIEANHPITTICGKCDMPKDMHTDYYRDNFDFPCERPYESIVPNGTDLYASGKGTPIQRNVSHINALFDKADMPDLILSEFYYKQWASDVTYNDYVVPYADVNFPTYFEDYSGPEAWSGSDLAKERIAHDRDVWGIGADDFYDPNDNHSLKEYNKVANWNDASYRETASTKEWTCTSILGETEGEYVLTSAKVNGIAARSKTYLGQVNTESVDRTRNVFLDNQEGFTSVELLNLELTEKYQRKLLNVFADKNGRVRIGSIVLTDNVDGTKTATCVRDDCRLSATSTSNPTRDDMERFVWAIVAHGNNHAAHWFTSRPSFHKVHRLNCDHAKCSESTHYCANILPEKEEVDSLVDHYRNCKTPGCNCVSLLMKVGA